MDVHDKLRLLAVGRYPTDARPSHQPFVRALLLELAAQEVEVTVVAPETLLTLGQLELIRGDVPAAAEALQSAAARTPESPEVWVALGEVAELEGDAGRAAEAYR